MFPETYTVFLCACKILPSTHHGHQLTGPGCWCCRLRSPRSLGPSPPHPACVHTLEPAGRRGGSRALPPLQGRASPGAGPDASGNPGAQASLTSAQPIPGLALASLRTPHPSLRARAGEAGGARPLHLPHPTTPMPGAPSPHLPGRLGAWCVKKARTAPSPAPQGSPPPRLFRCPDPPVPRACDSVSPGTGLGLPLPGLGDPYPALLTHGRTPPSGTSGGWRADTQLH